MSDLISSQAANDALYHVDEYNGRSVEAIRNLPSAQPERMKGQWVEDVAYYDEEGCPCIVTRCDQCGEPGFGRFCPNCGAEMRGEEDG